MRDENCLHTDRLVGVSCDVRTRVLRKRGGQCITGVSVFGNFEMGTLGAFGGDLSQK